MKEIPDRFYRAEKLIQLKPHDNILEVGCGTGLLLSLICPVLVTGKVVAVDSSAAMIKMARKNNEKCEKEGRISFINENIADTLLEKSSFDKVVSFNLNIFLKSNIPAIEIISQALKPGGDLYIFYQPPYSSTVAIMNTAIDFISQHQFEIIQKFTGSELKVPAFCVHAKNIKTT